MQVEALECAHRGELIGPGNDGVSAEREESTNLAFAFEEDLLGQRGGGRLTTLVVQVTNAGLRPLGQCLGLRRHDLRTQRTGRRHQATRVLHHFSGAVVATAQRVHHEHQVLHERRVRCHVRAGTGAHCTTRPGGETSGRFDDESGIDSGALTGVVDGVRIDGDAQFVEAVHVLCTEFLVVEIVFEDLTDERREERRVLARLHRQIQIGVVRHFGETRIDDDEAQTGFFRPTQTNERIEARQATRIAEGTDQRVATDHHGHVSRVDGLHTGSPCTVTQRCNGLARLVDRRRRVEARRTDRRVERRGDRQSRGVLVRSGAAIRGDGPWSVLGENAGHLLGDLVKGEVGVDRFVTVGGLLRALAQAAGMLVLEAEVASLHAGVALVHRVVLHAAHLQHRISCNVDVDIDCTTCMAETTKTALGDDRHVSPR